MKHSPRQTTPHILQNGFPKSGNLWVHNIMTCMLDEAGIKRPSYIQNRPVYLALKQIDFDIDGLTDIDHIEILSKRCFAVVRQNYREAIEDLERYISSTTVVWSHSQWDPVMTPIVYSAFDKLIYIIRDPRDALVSMSHFAFSPYRLLYNPCDYDSPDRWREGQYKSFITNWARHVREHLANAKRYGIHLIFYERLLNDTPREIEQLADYLGVELPRTARDTVVRRTSAEEMRKAAPHHVRQGRTGGWRDALSNRQIRWISRQVGPLLKLLGYQDSRALPEFNPDQIDARQIPRMTAERRSVLFGKIAERLR